MSVSIDEDPAGDSEGGGEARRTLAGWLDDYAAGRCERSDMEEAFLSVCGADDDASWDALALLDQYQRLKKVDVELARDLKSKIAQLAVGAPKQPTRGPDPAKLVASGTRKHQIVPDHRRESINTDDIDRQATRARTPPPPPPPAPAARITRMQPSPPQYGSSDFEDEDEEEADLEGGEDDADPSQASHAEPRPNPRSAPIDNPRVDNPREARRAPHAVAESAPAVAPTRIAPIKQQPPPAARVRAEAPTPARRTLRDRYELLSVLARGASSTVYKALDKHRANLSESARYVAIKVLDTTYEGRAGALAELERDFHQAQSLSHPNIASVFDLDKDNDTYFLVMELLEGDLLANVLRRLNHRPMTREHAFAVIKNIGSALAYAHRREIAHGDLKPRNIMITSDGELRVLEFGFAHARALQSGDIDSAHDGVAIGTPAYASAERVHGFEPDPSDDVYSLACIAYELLSGRHPYGGRSALLARAHGKRPQRIASLTYKQWHALQRALAWDRADRKIDVADLLTALGTADVENDAVPPELLSIPDDASGRRRRMWGMLAAVIAVVALVVFFITRIPPPLQSPDSTISAPASSAPNDTEIVTSEPVAPAQPATESPPPQATEEVTTPPVASSQRAEASSPVGGSENASTAPVNPIAARSGSLQFDKDTFVVTESDGSASLQLRRSGSTRGVLSFRWTLRSNSAEAGADYAGIGPGLEQIPSGVSSASVTIPLVSDALVENTELFLVELEALDEGVSVGELAHAAVIIVDDD